MPFSGHQPERNSPCFYDHHSFCRHKVSNMSSSGPLKTVVVALTRNSDPLPSRSIRKLSSGSRGKLKVMPTLDNTTEQVNMPSLSSGTVGTDKGLKAEIVDGTEKIVDSQSHIDKEKKGKGGKERDGHEVGMGKDESESQIPLNKADAEREGEGETQQEIDSGDKGTEEVERENDAGSGQEVGSGKKAKAGKDQIIDDKEGRKGGKVDLPQSQSQAQSQSQQVERRFQQSYESHEDPNQSNLRSPNRGLLN